MGDFTHFKSISGVDGVYAGDAGAEVQVAGADGQLYQKGTALTGNAVVLNKLCELFKTTVLDGSTGKKECVTNGVTLITGGTGIADMTLAAPSIGDVAIINIASLTSGNVVVTAEDGVTLDGTNNTATFDAAGEALVLAYASANKWAVILNIGGVALSLVGGD